MEMIDVLAICGSTREGSLNRSLLRTALRLAEAPLRVEMWDDHASVPRLDATRERPFPSAVAALRDRVAAADVLLLVTPELNRSVPGEMKDLVDWLSILAPPRPLTGKPVALMSASPHRFGGAFAQLQLGDLLRRAGAEVLSDLEVAVGSAHLYRDSDGGLTSEEIRRDIARLWERVLTRVATSRPVVPA
ncbi:NADPH-dependent FMN reductase [Streptosporangium sandarakinum]|uniref:Chromate reductase n=1 Tax=Streptosporangium sandarakinum TaxID=1260955 RepID=A0A852UQM1_9ACTN|nr:NAD(P)H-dependent oxidoreductase [Streptosporangium sandarakinum]NYF38509.1 chromate reductase [Streptosporangium sandarakinum]